VVAGGGWFGGGGFLPEIGNAVYKDKDHATFWSTLNSKAQAIVGSGSLLVANDSGGEKANSKVKRIPRVASFNLWRNKKNIRTGAF
jgi:hypothetical protein